MEEDSDDLDISRLHPRFRNPWFYVSLVLSAIILFLGGMIVQRQFSVWPGFVPRGGPQQHRGNPGGDTLAEVLPSWMEGIPRHSASKSLGDPKAPVTLTEYTDFQCPFCRQYTQNTFPKIVREYVRSGKVYYRIRHYPLTQIHDRAVSAAVASECAANQDVFWAFRHTIMTGNKDLSRNRLVQAAVKSGIADLKQYRRCLENRGEISVVKREWEEGRSRNIRATPSVFVGDQLLEGAQPYSRFRRAIENALRESAKSPGA